MVGWLDGWMVRLLDKRPSSVRMDLEESALYWMIRWLDGWTAN